MDKYLTMFSGQLDKEFKPETFFPDKEFDFMEWLKRKFITLKNVKKYPEENARINKRVDVKSARLTTHLPAHS